MYELCGYYLKITPRVFYLSKFYVNFRMFLNLIRIRFRSILRSSFILQKTNCVASRISNESCYYGPNQITKHFDRADSNDQSQNFATDSNSNTK